MPFSLHYQPGINPATQLLVGAGRQTPERFEERAIFSKVQARFARCRRAHFPSNEYAELDKHVKMLSRRGHVIVCERHHANCWGSLSEKS
jgi:hypothetical protein